MRGSVKWQVNQVYERSGTNRIGHSRHQAKESARNIGAKTSAEVARETGVYSYSTADQYRSVWRGCLQYAKDKYSQNDVEKLNSTHVQAYLESKIDAGVRRATYNSYVSALRKFEDALNRLGNGHEYDFGPGIEAASELRSELRQFEGSRAYDNPMALIEAIADPQYKLAAKLQYEGGCRRDEIATVRKANLNGDGQFEVRGKGGKSRIITVSGDAYEHFSELVMKSGQLPMHKSNLYNGYLEALKKAAEETGQKYTGSHGLRWNYARNRMKQFQREGGSYEGGLLSVSREMGHERGEITEHYLR